MFGRISQLLKWGVARFADALGARLLRPDGTVLSIPYVLSFPDFSPSILASLVAGSTASQSGNTVTIIATAHGVVGNATKNGYRIYYPGSPNIPAGWYGGFAWIDANTLTFQRAQAATVASESVYGGQPYLSNVTIASLTLAGGALGPRGRITVPFQRAGDATANAKNIRIILGGTVLSAHAVTTVSAGEFRLSARNIDSEFLQLGQSTADNGVTASAPNPGSIDTTQPQTLSLAALLFVSGQWLAISGAEVEVIKL